MATQDLAAISIESDGMLISIPTNSIASVAYNTESEITTFKYTQGPAADEVLRALRKLVVASDTGVSLINFGPMLVQAKTDSVEPLRKIGQNTEFACTRPCAE